MVPLSNLVTVRETVAPRELNHFNKLRSATITANLAPGYSLGEALTFLEDEAREAAAGTIRSTSTARAASSRSAVQRPLRHLPAGAGLHLPGAGGAVRELHRPVHHHADGAAVDDRRAARAQAHRRHAQRLQPDRAGHAGRADHQARHPDRRVRQPAAGAGHGQARRGGRGRRAAPAPDPDDHRRHGAGRGAAGARHRRRRREPPADRLGDRRRHAARHAAHAVRRADGLHAAGPEAWPFCVRATPPRPLPRLSRRNSFSE